MRAFLCKIFILIFCVFALAFNVKAEKDWTFMVYLDADNDLEPYGILDFLEMAEVGSDANLKILVMFDRIGGYDTSYDDWKNTRRGVVNQGDVPDTNWGQSMGEADMGDPATLRDFMIWGISNYPAKNYAVILWNHGDGWRSTYIELMKKLKTAETDAQKELIGKQIETLLKENSVSPDTEQIVKTQAEAVETENNVHKSVCWDDTDGTHLTTKDVQQAFIGIRNGSLGGNPTWAIDVIGFDACLMAMVEVAYELRNSKSFSDFMVASCKVEPGNGWPYDTILGDLKLDPTTSPRNFSINIVDRYMESYGSSAVTQSAIDLSKVETLTANIDTFAKDMRDYWNIESKKSTIRASASQVKSSLDTAIIKSGSNVTGFNGLTIYFPDGGIDPDYKGVNIDFATACSNWRSFLIEFPPMVLTGSWIVDARTATASTDFPYEYYDLYGFISNIVGPYDFTVDPTSLSIDENGGTGDIDVSLNVDPDSPVYIKATIIDNKPDAAEANAVITSASELTLTDTSIGTVTIQGLDDDFAGDDSCRVKLEIKGTSDPNFTHLAPKYVDVTVISDEKAELVAVPTALTIANEDGGTGTFDVSLAGKPRDDISLSVVSLDSNEATVPPNLTLNYSQSNWDTGQQVTVTAVPDTFVGDDEVEIQVSVKSAPGDPAYLAATNELVTVTILDDETDMTPDFNVAPGPWKKSTNYIAGNNVVSSDGDWYLCTKGGKSGSDALGPLWNDTIGASTTDNEVTWERIATPSNPTTVDLEINELGGKDYFTVRLNGRPHDPVTINLVSSDTTKAKVSPSTLKFTKDNWDIPQLATVTGIDDDLVGDTTITIDLSVAPTSDSHFVDEGYTASLNTSITSEDVAGFKVNPISLRMKEDFQSKTFEVVLTKGPVDETVVLDLTALAEGDVVGTETVTGDVTLNKATLTFTPDNWNVPQTVTVTSVHDYRLGDRLAIVEISVDSATTYAQWLTEAGVFPDDQYVYVELLNVDEAGFELSTNNLTVKEGTIEIYKVNLTAKPDSDVIINMASNDIAEATIDNSSLTFSPGNWNVKQNIQVTGVIDEYATDDNAIITNTVDSTSDANFTALKKQAVYVTVTNDNDINSAELTVSTTTLEINEIAPGNTGTFTVMLDAKPHSNVLVKVKSSDTNEATVNKELLTFTSSNWKVPQTITVTGTNNNFLGDGHAYISLKVQPTGSDPTFHTARERKVDVTIKENDPEDAGGINVTSEAIVVQENAGKETFFISLTARPRENVYVAFDIPAVPDGDPVIAKTKTEIVTFTTTNWNKARKILVIGDPGKESIAISSTTITLVVTGDPEWRAARDPDPGPINVTVTTDTSNGFDVTPPSLVVDENEPDEVTPGSGIISVVLTQAPTGNISIDYTSSNPAIATATAGTDPLVFTPANWFIPQEVTVTNAAGDITEDKHVTVTLSISAAPSDPAFLAMPDEIVEVTIRNLNPVALADDAVAINNKAGMVIANDPVLVRVLNNDSDPRGSSLEINTVFGVSGGTAVISDDKKTIAYTAPTTAGTYTFSYTITNNLSYNAVSPAATVDVFVYDGQQVALGSIVDLNATDLGHTQFISKPKIYAEYTDPLKEKDKNYNLKCLTKDYPTTNGKTENEFTKRNKLYNRSELNKDYRSGTGFADFTGQVTSMLFDCYASYLTLDTQLAWKLMLAPPTITAVKRFTTPFDDLDAPTAAWASELHPGSVIHVLGRFFGNKKPKVWLEYKDGDRYKAARCKVLTYFNPNFVDAKNKPCYMDVYPTSATYGDSELKVLIGPKVPKNWPYGEFTLVIDNGVGLASFDGLSGGLKSSGDTNDPPVANDDAFDGTNQGAKVKANTKNNLLDILNNDDFPNCDEVNVKIVGKPDSKGKVRWDRKSGKLKYTPAKDFGVVAEQVETFSYEITEKYTEQHLKSTATVTVTVEP